MLLKSLDLQGFKTFPDKTKLKFDKGITAVVGPNGSGKSNISDAIRWVLGEQSPKTLRCSRMEDVVFNGTDTRKKQGFSEVTLTIENKGRLLPVDSDEVSITRRYYRSGESDYLINRAVVRLKDVHELFMDTGLGRDGYSMIGQGKIDSIVSSKSEDRREMFEEAAGISRFRYRKTEAERRLKGAEENLMRLMDILKELEERVGPLKIQAEKAEKFIAYSNEKRGLEIALWLNTLEKSGAVLRDVSDKTEISKAQYESAQGELDGIALETERLFIKKGEYAAETDELRRKASVLQEMAAAKRSAVSVFQNDLSHNSETIDRIEREIESGDIIKHDLEERLRGNKRQEETLHSQSQELKSQYEKTAGELNTLSLDASRSSDVIQALSRELSELNIKSSELKVTEITCTRQLEELLLRSSALTESKNQKLLQINESEKTLDDYRKMLADTEEKENELGNAVKGLELRLQNRVNKFDSAKQNADSLMLDVSERSRRIRLLEELEKNLEGFSHSVKSVIKEAKNGGLKGIHGAVSRVISTDAKYTVAIETALGAAMQNIVTATEQDAKDAIDFLKRRDGGRATFLPLTTIKGNELSERGLEDCAGFIDLASRLCRCEPEYGGILKSLLGRIAICEDLNSAVNMAKRFGYKFRVVTLDGQVVNAGGSLTGGSLANKSGLLSRADEIEKNKKILNELISKHEDAKRELNEAQQELSKVNAEIIAARSELSVIMEQKIKTEAEIRSEQAYGASLIEQTGALEAEIRAGGEKTVQLAEQREKALANNKDYLEKIKNTEDQIEKTSGSRGKIKEEREALSSMLQEYRLKLLSVEKDIDAVKAEAETFIKAGENQEQRKFELQNEIKEITHRSEEIKSNIKIQEQEIQDAVLQAEGCLAKIEKLSEKQNEIEAAQSAMRQKERDKTTEREQCGLELARLEERKQGLQRQYDDIIAKLWEEYELTRREAEEQSTEIEDIQAASRRLNELKSKIKSLGTVNVAAVEEYEEVSTRYEFLNEQVTDVEKSRVSLQRLIGDLSKQMREEFVLKFNQINENFKSTFKELFGGGSAALELTDTEDILNCGIEIAVHPPGKIVVHLEALSGGEKALVAIALYFAIMKVRPAPFCVMDEIEAALDEVNVDRFAQYLRSMTKDTQFILITHRRGTMEEADVLYGVTMQDEGVSKLLEMHVTAAMKNR